MICARSWPGRLSCFQLSAVRRPARFRKRSKLNWTICSMAGAQFAVDSQVLPSGDGLMLKNGDTVAFDESGIDKIEFLSAPNPGEGMEAAGQDRLGRRDFPVDVGPENGC